MLIFSLLTLGSILAIVSYVHLDDDKLLDRPETVRILSILCSAGCMLVVIGSVIAIQQALGGI